MSPTTTTSEKTAKKKLAAEKISDDSIEK